MGMIDSHWESRGIPTVGMTDSLHGNDGFPAWESSRSPYVKS